MRRSLVLTTETARHPFRRSLPPHVLQPLGDVSVGDPARHATTQVKGWRLERGDMRDFLTAYGASCVAAMVFFF